MTFVLFNVCHLIMERYTLQQRLQIIKIYYQNSCSVTVTLRKLTPIFGRHNRPNKTTIQRLVQKFESTFSLQNVPVPVRQRNARSEENIAAVRESVANDPNVSIPRRSQQLEISQTTLWRILRKDLGLRAYKIALTQELKVTDHRMRRIFSDWALEQLETDPEFHKKIITSDEAHFWLNGFVNKQNCRIWSEANPQVIHEQPLHPEKLTVWCAFHAGGVIGPYFFVNDDGRTVTVNGERYRAMVTDFFWAEIDGMDLEDMWFQQDGATCHTARATIDLLKEKFDERVISRNGPVNWPARSCDLTPLDFFLWGYVKSQVYANKPATLDALRVNIERAIADIRADLCEKVM
jgi:Helix-turn-helix domain (DUF4817)